MTRTTLFASCIALGLGLASTAQSAVIYGGQFSGNDCSGGGFGNCYATTTGTQNSAATGAGRAIYKLNSGSGGAEIGGFNSVTGSEFNIQFNAQANTLSFTYAPTGNDPEIRYFTIKQSNGFALFYDLTAPITGFTANLSTYFPRNPGFSHITFFGSAPTTTVPPTTTPPPVTAVPEPATLALFGAGLVGLAAVRRRKRAA